MNKKFGVIIIVLVILFSGVIGFILGRELFIVEDKTNNNVVDKNDNDINNKDVDKNDNNEKEAISSDEGQDNGNDSYSPNNDKNKKTLDYMVDVVANKTYGNGYSYGTTLEYDSTNEKLVMAARLYQYAYLVNRCYAFEYNFDNQNNIGTEVLNYDYVSSFFTDIDMKKTFGTPIEFSGDKYYDGSMCGRGYSPLYFKTKIELKEDLSNKLVFNVTEYYYGHGEGHYEPDTSTYTTTNSEFILEKIDDKWKIKQFHMPN